MIGQPGACLDSSTTMEEFLNSTGLNSFQDALSSNGISSFEQLKFVSDEFLLDSSIGMKKLHVNKFRKALEKIQQEKILNEGSSESSNKTEEEVFIDFQVCDIKLNYTHTYISNNTSSSKFAFSHHITHTHPFGYVANHFSEYRTKYISHQKISIVHIYYRTNFKKLGWQDLLLD